LGEVVSEFVAGDVTVSGGTLGNFATLDNRTFTFDLAPTGDGTITVDVAADVAEDLAGNKNLAATQFSIVSDRTAPTPVMTSSEMNPSNALPIPVSVNFGEVVSGFVVGDVTVSGGTLGNFVTSDNRTFTFDLTPGGDGTITVDVAADVAEDLAGNKNLSATQFSIVSDGTSPTVMSFTRQTPASNPTDAEILIFRAAFDEDVMRVGMDSFAVNGPTTAAVTAVSWVNAGTYDVTVSGGDLANFNGTVGLDLAAGQDISDLAGNSLPTGEPEIDETYVVDNDEDGDGVPGYLEDGAPNSGDGNNDGIPDREQKNVASLPCFTGEGYVTLIASEEFSLNDTDAADNPSPGDAPNGVGFPAGFVEFGVSGLVPGGSVAVTVYVETTANTYYKFGPTPDNSAPHWYPFMYDGSTGAKIYSDRVVLHFVDGKRGDDDLIANGSIIDTGAPAVTEHPWQNPVLPEDVNNQGGVTPLDALTLIADINTHSSHALPAVPNDLGVLPPYLDVTGDDSISPLDVLAVIAYLNNRAGAIGQGEGEPGGEQALVPLEPTDRGAVPAVRQGMPAVSISVNADSEDGFRDSASLRGSTARSDRGKPHQNVGLVASSNNNRGELARKARVDTGLGFISSELELRLDLEHDLLSLLAEDVLRGTRR